MLSGTREMTNEVFTLNPEFLLQDIEIEFFDFTFIMNADGTMKECKLGDQILEPAIGSALFLIREKYMRKVNQHKLDKKKIENLNKMNEQLIKKNEHKKHCYMNAIYEIQKTADHYKYTIRAFEQLARSNENIQREIAYEKTKNKGFSIGSEE